MAHKISLETTKKGIQCSNNCCNHKKTVFLELPNEIIFNIYRFLDFENKIIFLITSKSILKMLICDVSNSITMRDIIKIISKKITKKQKKIISYFSYIYKQILIYKFTDMDVNVIIEDKSIKTYIENEIFEINFTLNKRWRIYIKNKKLNICVSENIYYFKYYFDCRDGVHKRLINNFKLNDIYEFYIFIYNYDKKIPRKKEICFNFQQNGFYKIIQEKFNFLNQDYFSLDNYEII